MKQKAALDPSKLEPRPVRLPGIRQYYVRVGMLGKFPVGDNIYACEVWIGRHKDSMRPKAYSIGGVAPEDASKIKHGEDLFERVNLVLDVRKRIKGVIWK